MFASWTFGRRIFAAFAIVVVALAAVAIVGYQGARSLVRNDELVAHTHLVRRTIASLQAQLVDTETGQRGFILTGRDEYLEPYHAAAAAEQRLFGELRSLVSDNPNQIRRLEALRPTIESYLARLRRNLELRKTSLEAAIAGVGDGDGKKLMDQIRGAIGDMDAEETTLLEMRRRDAESAAAFTTNAVLWGSVAAAVLTILIAVWIARALTRQIGNAVSHIQSSSTELQAAANQQASSSREQSTAMTEIATTVNELLATSRQIAESAQRVAGIAGQTAAGARAGDATVVKGSAAIATVRQQVDTIVNHMLELGKRSQQVGNVLDIVAELAEQTNILAINATIEAAGAGESGRRFGVVADEIRKLADRVGASTKEIRGMVDDVRSAVNTTVMATEAGAKAVDVGAGQVAEMASSFRQIAGLVSTTTDAAREIELSTKQQASAVEQVTVAIGNAAQATRETEASATQTLQTSSQLANLSTQLLGIVQQA